MVNPGASRTGIFQRQNAVQPTEWEVNDFKSLEHAGFPLEHLTVLTGTNSSGKSSLIQSLLLLAQSSDDEIILNGVLVRLGDGLDVIRTGSNRVTISYSATTRNPDGKTRQEW